MEPKRINLKNATVKFVDGTSPTPFSLAIKMDDGTLTYQRRREVRSIKDRGKIDYLEEGDEQNMSVSIEGRFAAIRSSSGDPVTPIEFLEKEGGASAYKSTSGDCEIDTIDIVVEMRYSCGTIQDEVITFPKFAFEDYGPNFKDGNMSLNGICNAKKPTSIRTDLTT
jgi:hypothetical protein